MIRTITRLLKKLRQNDLSPESMRLDKTRAVERLRARGLSKEEIAQWLLVHDRCEFVRRVLRDANGNPWQPRAYQVDSLQSYAFRKVHCDGRDVGKTTEIELIVAWAVVALPGREMLVATQCENHLYPLMDRVVRRIEITPELAGCLVEMQRSPSWHLRFSNGFVLWGRIAGPRGINFQGLHVDWQIIDEAQEMTEQAWAELYQALNSGGRRWVYGVPNGLRNTFYRMTFSKDAEHYNWPSSIHPEFTPEKDAELAELYGGRNSPGYIHRVLGQHGAPAHAVFDLEDYLACVHEDVDFWQVTLTGSERFECPVCPPSGIYYLGCDLGYARDPSEFVIYQAKGPDLVNVARIHLEHVPYGTQQEVIQELDRAYNFRGIGIDCGNSGRAVAHALMAQSHHWCEKIYSIEFGGTIELGLLPDGKKDKRPAKLFMTELLVQHMRAHTIVFPRLPERESQYASHTYTIGTHGKIIYDKGEDHLIDADRCAVLAHYLDTHQYEPGVQLGIQFDPF